jgi:hypothetical protein
MSSEQSNPFMDASNTFSVNITTNVWLTAGTTLTLIGLQVLKQLEAHSPMFIIDAFSLPHGSGAKSRSVQALFTTL